MFAPVGCYFDDATELGVKLTFAQPMDQGVVPDVGSFTFERNGAPYVPDPPAWQDAETLQFDSAEAFAGTTRVDVSLDTEDANLKTSLGLVHTVFSLEDISLCP